MGDEQPKPPGICDECAADNLFVWSETTLTVHCRHTDTGAVGIVQGGELQWSAWRPISRERFEAVATQAARDAAGGGADH